MQTSLAYNVPTPDFDIHKALNSVQGKADWISLRYVSEISHSRRVRNEQPDYNGINFDQGVMTEVLVDGQFGYAGTSDLSISGVQAAVTRAIELAKATAKLKIFNYGLDLRPANKGNYRSPHKIALDAMSLAEFTDLLMATNKKMKVSDEIVNRISEARFVEVHFRQVSTSGLYIDQQFLMILQNFEVVAQRGSRSQTRSLNGPRARCYQGGLEHFDKNSLLAECETAAKEALQLLGAEDCPTEKMDLLLAPDQMMLQIHESIGHPLEMDRILGDERNYAGWSFVKPEDFGKLQYGSKHLNATFDPSIGTQFASYGYDDSGMLAKKEFLIKDGVLVRGLGGLESQGRMGLPGVANFRADGWRRAPIDRMANLNIEPGSTSLADMISQTERGVFMKANVSWSIDDYRDKFQFGCEWGQLIENGKLTKVVRNPNYRGRTLQFWNSMKAAGRPEETMSFGTPFCGKGEPGQTIRVSHRSPHCLFSNIEVFGGGH